MRGTRYVIVDVFCDEKFKGNQLAVFLDAGSLDGAEMQALAREMNFSESTFILDSKPNDKGWPVRIFTPQAEVPFAGHPTLGFVGDTGGVVRGSWVARVNGSEIPQTRFRDAATNLDQYYRQLFGTNYDQIRPQLGIRQQALQTVIEKELILQDASRLGMECTPAEIAERIRTIFQDSSGVFVGKQRKWHHQQGKSSDPRNRKRIGRLHC